MLSPIIDITFLDETGIAQDGTRRHLYGTIDVRSLKAVLQDQYYPELYWVKTSLFSVPVTEEEESRRIADHWKAYNAQSRIDSDNLTEDWERE